MIRLTASYPNTPGARFDFDYYLSKHFELFQDRMKGGSLESIVIEKGISGGAPGSAAPYVCVLTATFKDATKFNAAWAKAVPELLGDAANYTDLAPVVQIGEILTK